MSDFHTILINTIKKLNSFKQVQRDITQFEELHRNCINSELNCAALSDGSKVTSQSLTNFLQNVLIDYHDKIWFCPHMMGFLDDDKCSKVKAIQLHNLTKLVRYDPSFYTQIIVWLATAVNFNATCYQNMFCALSVRSITDWSQVLPMLNTSHRNLTFIFFVNLIFNSIYHSVHWIIKGI